VDLVARVDVVAEHPVPLVELRDPRLARPHDEGRMGGELLRPEEPHHPRLRAPRRRDRAEEREDLPVLDDRITGIRGPHAVAEHGARGHPHRGLDLPQVGGPEPRRERFGVAGLGGSDVEHLGNSIEQDIDDVYAGLTFDRRDSGGDCAVDHQLGGNPHRTHPLSATPSFVDGLLQGTSSTQSESSTVASYESFREPEWISA